MEEEVDNFEILLGINPIDWINIADPLRKGLICLKDCIFKLKRLIKANKVSIEMNQDDANKRFDYNEESARLIKMMIEKVDTDIKNKIEEVSESLLAEVAMTKKNITADYEFKQKSSDKKINILEEAMATMKRTLQSFPTQNEMEDNISKAIKEARHTIKTEISDFLVIPEIRKVNMKIEGVSEDVDKNKKELEEIIEKLKINIKRSDAATEERLNSIESAIAELHEQRVRDNKSYEGFMTNLQSGMSNLENQSNKKHGLLNVVIEKQQKQVNESDKKIKDLKEYLNNIQKEFTEFKKEQEVEKDKLEKMQEKFEGLKKDIEKVKEEKIEVNSEPLEETIPKTEAKEVKELKEVSILKEARNENESKEAREITEFKSDTNTTAPISLIKLPAIQNDPVIETLQKKLSNKKQVFRKASELKPEPVQIIQPIDLQTIDEKISKLVSDHVSVIEQKVNQSKSDFELHIKDIRDKLSWFPLNVSEFKSKNPFEARIFAIEARLRMEENSRVEQYNNLVTLINQIKLDFSISPNLPLINSGRFSVRHERRMSEGIDTKTSPDSEPKINLSAFAPKVLRTLNKYSNIS